MELDPYLGELSDGLTAATRLGDEAVQRAAASLAAVLAPSARMALLNALTDLAAEVSHALDGPVVELRLEGREVAVVVSRQPDGWGSPEPDDVTPRHDVEPEPGPDGAQETSRITLRLPESLKAQAEAAAAGSGRSLNTWLTDAVHLALGRGRSADPGRPGRPTPDFGRRESGPGRLRGWVTG